MVETWTMAQQSVVGSVLISPEVLPMLLRRCRPEDMTGACATIYAAMQVLFLEGRVVDPVTVLERVGPEYRETIVELMKVTPTAANAEEYAAICAEQARLSRLQVLAAQIMNATRMDDAMPAVQSMTDAVAAQHAGRVTGLMQAMVDFYDRHQAAAPQYIPFGFPKVDRHLTAELGDVVVLGGYPSDGKSALMLQWAWALSETYSVGVFSFETQQRKLMDRLVANAAAVNMDVIKHNQLSSSEWGLVTLMGRLIPQRKLEIVEAAGMSAGDILATALARRYQIIFVDYVQLVQPAQRRRGGTRAEEVAEISMQLHTMAQRHKIMVVELSQLSRPATKDKKVAAPTLASLRESGQLEQDADVVMLLYRTKPDSPGSPRRLHIAKNKEGTTGMIDLAFNGKIQRFTEDTGEDDVPQQLETEAKKRRAMKAAGQEQEALPL